MTIERIISDYLATNNCITIPQLGTLLKGGDGQLFFVEFVDEDNDTLHNLVVSQAEMSEIEALAAVDSFISRVSEGLLTEEGFSIEGCVRLVRGEDGVVSTTATTASAVVAMPEATIIPEPITPEPITPDPTPIEQTEQAEEQTEQKSHPDMLLIVAAVAIVVAISVVVYSIIVGWQTGQIELPEALDSFMLRLFGDGLSHAERVVESI